MAATTDKLSHTGKAAIAELETNHQQYHKKLWALASGTMVGDIQHGPMLMILTTVTPIGYPKPGTCSEPAQLAGWL
jgi:hypothetical protein